MPSSRVVLAPPAGLWSGGHWWRSATMLIVRVCACRLRWLEDAAGGPLPVDARNIAELDADGIGAVIVLFFPDLVGDLNEPVGLWRDDPDPLGGTTAQYGFPHHRDRARCVDGVEEHAHRSEERRVGKE